jgi:hypothetical protein
VILLSQRVHVPHWKLLPTGSYPVVEVGWEGSVRYPVILGTSISMKRWVPILDIDIIQHAVRSYNVMPDFSNPYYLPSHIPQTTVTCKDNLIWSHQSFDNSLGTFEPCVLSVTPQNRTLESQMMISPGTCDTSASKTAVLAALETALEDNNVACLADNTCSVGVLTVVKLCTTLHNSLLQF